MSSAGAGFEQTLLGLLPAPQVEVQGESWIGANGVTSSEQVYAWVRDIDPAVFTDTDLDATIELWRYKRTATRKLAGGTRRDYWRKWVHPSNWDGTDVTGRSSSGGGHYNEAGAPLPNRTTEWKLANPLSFPGGPPGEFQRIGPITIGQDFYKLASIPVDIPNLPTVGNAPMVVGSGSPSSAYGANPGFAQSFPPDYPNTAWFRSHWALRLSVKDPNGDGTVGDRLGGPFSERIICAPTPYPVVRDPADVDLPLWRATTQVRFWISEVSR